MCIYCFLPTRLLVDFRKHFFAPQFNEMKLTSDWNLTTFLVFLHVLNLAIFPTKQIKHRKKLPQTRMFFSSFEIWGTVNKLKFFVWNLWCSLLYMVSYQNLV